MKGAIPFKLRRFPSQKYAKLRPRVFALQKRKMKKQILMIGNTDDLPGVPVDINDYYYFFLSPAGGNWCSDEIEILMNPTRSELFDTINEIEESDFDYVIVVFSGHGGRVGSETMLAINGQGEEIALRGCLRIDIASSAVKQDTSPVFLPGVPHDRTFTQSLSDRPF